MCQCFLRPDVTHIMCFMCLGEKHVPSVLEGAVCVHCEHFSMRKLCSRLSLFLRESEQPSTPCGSAAAEVSRRLQSWGSQVELANEFKKGMNIYHSSSAGESKLLDDDVLSLMSSVRQRVCSSPQAKVSRKRLLRLTMSLSTHRPLALHMMSCWTLCFTPWKD